MANMISDSIDLRTLFVKLGHQLEEIRVRALKNILSKLEHNLVCDADLVQERHLHIRLLEWFNFPSCPLQQQVLALILRLSKHQSAAQIFVDIGGVEFLSQLRTNSEQSFHRLIDDILNNLFHLPKIDSLPNSHCHYQQSAKHDEASTRSVHANTPANVSADEGIVTRPGVGKHPSPEPSVVGYFGNHQTVVRSHPDLQKNACVSAASCFKLNTFPWIPLTQTDRHVLSSTDKSLNSKDVSLVISACEFLSDVVFQDFPAEVFLQRPFIIKSLLSLLVPPSADCGGLGGHAIQTLRDLTSALVSKIHYYQDPCLYTPRPDFDLSNPSGSSASSFLSQSLGSSDSRPSVIGHSDTRQGGDGQDGDSSNNSNNVGDQIGDLIEHTDVEEIQSLQFLQWTITQYSMSVLEKLLPCMKSSDERFIQYCLELTHQLATMLQESVVASALWEDDGPPARELREKYTDVLEMIGDVIYLHHHSNLSEHTPPAELSQHRIAYMGLAIFLVRLIQILVPPENIKSALPEFTGGILGLMSQDSSLSCSYPEISSFTRDLLQQLDPDNHSLLLHVDSICQSMKSTCVLLLEYADLSDDSVLDCLSLAEDGLHSLVYHQNLDLVNTCVNLASFVCRKSSPNPVCVQRATKLLLTVMSHPLTAVRLNVYTTILSIVKDALGVEHVVEPTSTLSNKITFLFDEKLLYELTCYGCSDSDSQVQDVCEEILVYLLKSQLLLPAVRWQQLLDALVGVMPLLQGYCKPDTKLSECIFGLIVTEMQNKTGVLPQLERFRATLRSMFSPHPRVRMEGLGKLAWFLANEADSMRKMPFFSDLDVSKLTNLMGVDVQRSILDEDLDQSVFTGESLHKVFEIFVSENVESTVRHSAGEQLAIIMQDSSLHGTFLKLDGVNKILLMMRQGTKKLAPKTLNPHTTVLPCMVKMLRCLVQFDPSLRHKWAHEAEIYFLIMRCCLLHSRDPAARREVSELLAFLLFDEVAQIKVWKEQGQDMPATYSLPNFVATRYALPFRCPTHDLVSPHRSVLPSDPDPLCSASLGEQLRVAWNAGWYGSIQDAVSAKPVPEAELKFNKALSLTAMDAVILSTSYMPVSLRQCMRDIENATGHSMVLHAVTRLCSYLILSAQHPVVDLLEQLGWRQSIERFVRVVPSSMEDDMLLDRILYLLVLVTRGPSIPQDVLSWMLELTRETRGPLLSIVTSVDNHCDMPDENIHARRQLIRNLLKFLQNYVAKYPYSLFDRTIFDCVNGDLTKSLLTRINRRDTTHFYNLASLESTLLCLMQVTARPQWSSGCHDQDSLSLCLQTLQNLSEVISAFHFGRGATCMSYMGRGVTRSATVCLRHLAHEMATQLSSQDWPRNWLFARQATADSVGESGLHWLIPLWSYRDTEVRVAGIGIAAALASTESGRITMATQCQHIPGGIWGSAFSVLLDQTECSLVRQQAALLLVNLTSQPLHSGEVETTASVWQGPIVRNEETQVSLVGVAALLALLHHSQFYKEMRTLISNYYSEPSIQHVSVNTSTYMSHTTSQVTMLTTGSASPSGLPHMTHVSNSSGMVTPSPTGHLALLTLRPNTVGFTQLSTPSSHPTLSPQQHSASCLTDTLSAGEQETSCSTEPAECQSVATPCLISAVCHLLHNLLALLPDETLASIKRQSLHVSFAKLLDVPLVEAYMTELCNTMYKQQYRLAFQDLIKMYTHILDLLRSCVLHDSGIRLDILSNTNLLKQIVGFFSISYSGDSDTSAHCVALWTAVFNLLSALLSFDGRTGTSHLNPVITKHWAVVSGRIVSVLKDFKQGSEVSIAAMRFLAEALCVESKLMLEDEGPHPDIYYILDRLDSHTDDTAAAGSVMSGSAICQELIKLYDAICRKPLEHHFQVKMAVHNSLKMIVNRSTSAKSAALKAGLVETVCEHLKHVHIKLNLDILEISKMTLPKKKENPEIAELILNFTLLQNLMYDSHDAKMALYGCGLARLIHGVWAWCEVDGKLMETTLALLCTYTANCTPAASSLALTSAHQTLEKPVHRVQHGGNSLVHALIKLLQREVSSRQNINVIRAVFSLLANLTVSQECRGILWKSNFLHDFAGFSPRKNNKSRYSKVLDSHWLDLLAKLSFSTDGQNMILKIEDSVALLLEFGSEGSELNKSLVLLVLRNLCFHAANKPKLLTNDKLVPYLLMCLDEGTGDMRRAAISALLALAYNNQKAKGVLKSGQVLRLLQDSYNQLVTMTAKSPSWVAPCVRDLHSILQLLRS